MFRKETPLFWFRSVVGFSLAATLAMNVFSLWSYFDTSSTLSSHESNERLLASTDQVILGRLKVMEASLASLEQLTVTPPVVNLSSLETKIYSIDAVVSNLSLATLHLGSELQFLKLANLSAPVFDFLLVNKSLGVHFGLISNLSLSLNASVIDLQSRLRTQDTFVTTALSTLQIAVASLVSDIQNRALQSDLSVVLSRLASLESRLSLFAQGQITTLTGKVAVLEDASSDQASLISSLLARVTLLEAGGGRSSSSTGAGPSPSSSTGTFLSSSSSAPLSSTGASPSSTGGSPLPSYFSASLDVRSSVVYSVIGNFASLVRSALGSAGEMTIVGDSITCGIFTSNARTQAGITYAARLRYLYASTSSPGYINCNRFATGSGDAYAAFGSYVDVTSVNIAPSTDGLSGYAYSGRTYFRGAPGGVNFCLGAGSLTYGPLFLDVATYTLTVSYYVGPNFGNSITIVFKHCTNTLPSPTCTSQTLDTFSQSDSVPSSEVYDETGSYSAHYLRTKTYFVAVRATDFCQVVISGSGPASNHAGIDLTLANRFIVSTKCESGYKMEHFATPYTFVGSGIIESFRLRLSLQSSNTPVPSIAIVALGMNDDDASMTTTLALRTIQTVAGRFPLLFVFFPSQLRNRASFFSQVRNGIIAGAGSRPVAIIDFSQIPEATLVAKGYYSSRTLKGVSALDSGDGIHPGDTGATLIANHIKHFLDGQ